MESFRQKNKNAYQAVAEIVKYPSAFMVKQYNKMGSSAKFICSTIKVEKGITGPQSKN